MLIKKTVLPLVLLLCFASGALAETAKVAFSGLKADPTLPVEVKADTLSVDQAKGEAIFTGNVTVTQGDMKLTANEVKVEYAADQKAVNTIYATGDVLLINATEAAQGDAAVYTVATGAVQMTGNVLLTQGQTVISGDELTMDIGTGIGQMHGNISTTFVPGNKTAPAP
jgi:lipopolysaccharide export system protein LptA